MKEKDKIVFINGGLPSLMKLADEELKTANEGTHYDGTCISRHLLLKEIEKFEKEKGIVEGEYIFDEKAEGNSRTEISKIEFKGKDWLKFKKNWGIE